MRQAVRFNFHLSLLLLILFCLAVLFGQALDGSRLEPFGHRWLLWAGLVASLQVLAWLFYYRHSEGHALAFCMSVIIFTPVIGSFMSESVNDIEYADLQQYLLLYVAVSHLLYAFQGWQEWLPMRDDT